MPESLVLLGFCGTDALLQSSRLEAAPTGKLTGSNLSAAPVQEKTRSLTNAYTRQRLQKSWNGSRFTNLPCPNAPTNCMRSFFHSAVLRPRA
jgi:hypothetical protein